MNREDLLSKIIIGAAIEVHRHLGPGLLESAYEACLAHELEAEGIAVERQKALPVKYKGMDVGCGYRLDLVVEDLVIVELKAVRQFEAVHHAQMLTYLQLTGCKLGLMLNFNVAILRHGVKRVVNGL